MQSLAALGIEAMARRVMVWCSLCAIPITREHSLNLAYMGEVPDCRPSAPVGQNGLIA